MKKIFIFKIVIIFSLNIFAQKDTIFLNFDGNEKFRIKNINIEYFTDTTNLAELKDVISSEYDTLFKNPTNISITKLYDNIWFRLTIKNTSDKDGNWILAVGDFSYLDFYIIDKNGNIELQQSGVKRPASAKLFKNSSYEQALIKLDPNETKTVYIKANTDVALKIQNIFLFYDIYKYNEQLIAFYFRQGVFFGFLFLIMIYSLLLFYYTQHKSYFFYGMYIFFLIIALLALLQFFRNYIFPENPTLNNHFGFSIFIAYISYFLFFKEIIEIKNTDIKLEKFISFLIKGNFVVSVFIIVASFVNIFMYSLFALLLVLTDMVVSFPPKTGQQI